MSLPPTESVVPPSKKLRPEPELPTSTGACARFETLALKGDSCCILNAANAGVLQAVLAKPTAEAPAEPAKSDCDEQLLITLTLAAPSKLHSLHFSAPDQPTAPKTVKLFLNKDNLSFDDVEDLPATQTLVLHGTSQTIPLHFVKFQNVSSLVVFIEDNQGGGDVTCLSHLELIGTPLSTTNMSDLKKGG